MKLLSSEKRRTLSGNPSQNITVVPATNRMELDALEEGTSDLHLHVVSNLASQKLEAKTVLLSAKIECLHNACSRGLRLGQTTDTEVPIKMKTLLEFSGFHVPNLDSTVGSLFLWPGAK